MLSGGTDDLKKHIILDKPVGPNRNIAQIYQYVSTLSGFDRIYFFTNFCILFFDSEQNATIALKKFKLETHLKARPDRWSKEQPQAEWVPYYLEPTSTLFIARRSFITISGLAMLFANERGFGGVEETACGFCIEFSDVDSAQVAFNKISARTNLAPYFYHDIKTINLEVQPEHGSLNTLYLPVITESRAIEQVLIYFMSFPRFLKVKFEHHHGELTPHAYVHFCDAQTASVAESFSIQENNIHCTLIEGGDFPTNHHPGTKKSVRLRILLPRDFLMTEKIAVRFFTMFRGVELLHGNGLSFRTEQDAEVAAHSLNLLTNFGAEYLIEDRPDPDAQLILPRLKVPASALLCIWNYPNKLVIMYILAKQVGLQDLIEVGSSGKVCVYVLFSKSEHRNAAVAYLDAQCSKGATIPFLYDPDCDVPLEAAIRLGIEIVGSRLASPLSPEQVDRIAPMLRRPRHDTKYPNSSGSTEPSRSLWVGNIAPKAHADEIQNLFSTFGSVERVWISVPNYTGFSYGFVKFERLEDAIEAKSKLHDGLVDDIPIKVQFARPSTKITSMPSSETLTKRHSPTPLNLSNDIDDNLKTKDNTSSSSSTSSHQQFRYDRDANPNNDNSTGRQNNRPNTIQTNFNRSSTPSSLGSARASISTPSIDHNPGGYQMCMDYVLGSCLNRHCTFSHDPERFVCKNFVSNKCTFGDGCKLGHDPVIVAFVKEHGVKGLANSQMGGDIA